MIALALLALVLFAAWPRYPGRAWWFHWAVLAALFALIVGRAWALASVYNVNGGHLPW